MFDRPRCPRTGCGSALQPVTQAHPKMLSDDQFDAAKKGEWFCDGHTDEAPYIYFWNAVREAKPEDEIRDVTP